MNREIKFRGKRKDTGEWVYGYFHTMLNSNGVERSFIQIQFQIGIIYDDNIKIPYEVIPSSVGQFTGNYDSTIWDDAPESEKKRWIDEGHKKDDWHGIEIYEGDIVKRGTTISDIIWKDTGFALRKGISICDVWTPTKVIGNITENYDIIEKLIN